MAEKGWDGVPERPEEDGWHWVSGYARYWHAKARVWAFGGRYIAPRDLVENWFGLNTYLGPCLTPTQLAARLAEERARALEEAAGVCDEWATSNWTAAEGCQPAAPIRQRFVDMASAQTRVARAIRARARDAQKGEGGK